jgi:hypothetical protein
VSTPPAITGDISTEEDALAIFAVWYDKCLTSGIEPEAVVARMGSMVLVTHEETIQFLDENDKL